MGADGRCARSWEMRGQMADRRGKRSCLRVLLPVLGSLMLFGLAAPACAQSEPYNHTAENPAPLYWYRNVDGVGRQSGAMDPRLSDISDAFGWGDFGVSRRLAEALVDDPEVQPALRAEAAAYVVEAYLAQGEFEKAGQIAKELEDAEMAARVASLKEGYSAALSRLDLTLARTEAERAALAFRRARVHRQAGCLALTQEAYWGVITEHPDSLEAVRAASEIVKMHKAYGTSESLAEVCEALVGFDPNGDVAVATCHAIGELPTPWQQVEIATMRDILRGVAETHPNTRAGAASRLNIGELLIASEQYEEAEEVWVHLVDENFDAEISQETRYRLADLRYERGMKAFTERDYESAVRWLGALIPDVEFVGIRASGGRTRPVAHPSVRSKQRVAVFLLGESYEKLGRWQEAVNTYARLAVPGNPAEEVALFRAARCHLSAGDRVNARRCLDELTERFPEGRYTQSAAELM